jgi:3-dehydroquinate synthetase
MSKDKKALFSSPRFVLLKSIGQTVGFQGEFCTTIEEKILRRALERMILAFKK